MKPLCDICGTRHESYQAHVFASNAASNKVTASNRVASNNGPARQAVEHYRAPVKRDDGVVLDDGLRVAKTSDLGDVQPAAKQRWSRESYNAYQREYMRKRRLAAKS